MKNMCGDSIQGQTQPASTPIHPNMLVADSYWAASLVALQLLHHQHGMHAAVASITALCFCLLLVNFI